jgi:hypothetical protein
MDTGSTRQAAFHAVSNGCLSGNKVERYQGQSQSYSQHAHPSRVHAPSAQCSPQVRPYRPPSIVARPDSGTKISADADSLTTQMSAADVLHPSSAMGVRALPRQAMGNEASQQRAAHMQPDDRRQQPCLEAPAGSPCHVVSHPLSAPSASAALPHHGRTPLLPCAEVSSCRIVASPAECRDPA